MFYDFYRGGRDEIWQCRPKSCISSIGTARFRPTRSTSSKMDQCFQGNAQQTPLTFQSGERWIQTLQHNLEYNLSKCLTSAQHQTVVRVRTLRTSRQACHLRLAASGDLFVPTASIKIIGPCGFIHAGLEQSTSCLLDPSLSFLPFKQLLKTELFVRTRTQLACTFVRFYLFWKA